MEETKDTRSRIIEAFSSDGCPVCTMLRRDELDSLYQWVGQSNNNAKNSERIKCLLDAGGFCNYHFWQFQEMSSHYGSANIGAQLIKKLLETIRADKQKYFADATKHSESHLRVWLIECPLCCELSKKERAYLKELLVVLTDNKYKTEYEQSCGLCIPHLMKITSYVDNDLLLGILYETEIYQLEKIKSDASSFVSKRYPPQRWKQTKDEKKSWFRAIEKIAGRRST